MPTAQIVYDCPSHGYVSGPSKDSLESPDEAITIRGTSGGCPSCGEVVQIVDYSARVDSSGSAVTEIHHSGWPRLPELRTLARSEWTLRLGV
jgi:hypothetical protein